MQMFSKTFHSQEGDKIRGVPSLLHPCTCQSSNQKIGFFLPKPSFLYQEELSSSSLLQISYLLFTLQEKKSEQERDQVLYLCFSIKYSLRCFLKSHELAFLVIHVLAYSILFLSSFALLNLPLQRSLHVKVSLARRHAICLTLRQATPSSASHKIFLQSVGS